LRVLPSPTPSPTRGRPTTTHAPPTPSGPTPTPLTHFVEQGETLLEIAAEYGVELDDLLTANPGINPRLLSIGQAILIPGPEGASVTLLAPAATPMPLGLSGPVCYPALTGGLWCFAWATNDVGAPLEGIAASISLLDDEGATIASQTAYSPLNLVREGEQAVLAAHFGPPGEPPERVAVTLVSALGLTDTSRYLPTEIETTDEGPTSTGLGWRVQGSVHLGVAGEVDVARGIVLVVGQDSDGWPVGMAIWEFSGTVTPGSPVPFDVMVFSHGGRIARAMVIAEAQAAAE
jgi:LysM repeat protein